MVNEFSMQKGGGAGIWIIFFILLLVAFWILIIQLPRGWPIQNGVFCI
jgi:hypothetical protein